MLKLILSFFFMVAAVGQAAAQSFDADDITAFGKAAKALEQSEVLKDDGGGLSLGDLNPFAGVGAFFSGSTFDRMITESGDFVLHRSIAAILKSAPEQQYYEEVARIAQASGFEGVDDWASTSDAVMAALFTIQLAPLLEEMGGGYNLKDARRRASEALRKKGVEEARRRAKDAAIREAVRQAGYGDAGALIVGDDGNVGRELLGELREILSDEAANFASGQLMMRAPLLKRLATLAAVTPAEDVEFLRRNKRRLPKDMRWDD